MSTQKYTENIKRSGLRINDRINPDDSNLWIPKDELEKLLKKNLLGMEFSNLPLRTRSKIVKSEICKILGYPIPLSFAKTKPRFLGQQFDVYIQKSNNLQIWNEEIEPKRRYVIIRLSNNDVITGIKILTGLELLKLDKTGTLTQKYQARLIIKEDKSGLMSNKDTDNISSLLAKKPINLGDYYPNELPQKEALLPIVEIYQRLQKLVNCSFDDAGKDQERNRGAKLHQLVCRKLGYRIYHDDGKFPDISHQLLEIKLQTSPTIDLGLVRPNSTKALSLPPIDGINIRHCDVRYAIFYSSINGNSIMINNLFLITGEDFFSRFPQFQGKVLNKKLQIPLSDELFE